MHRIPEDSVQGPVMRLVRASRVAGALRRQQRCDQRVLLVGQVVSSHANVPHKTGGLRNPRGVRAIIDHCRKDFKERLSYTAQEVPECIAVGHELLQMDLAGCGR